MDEHDHDELELDHEDEQDHEDDGMEDVAAGVMTKAELVDEVARVVQLTKKQAETIVNIVFDSIVDSLRAGQKTQSEDGRESRSADQENPVLQARQGAEGADQQSSGRRGRRGAHGGSKRG